MVLMVPDADDPALEEQEAREEESSKAALDEGEAGGSEEEVPRALQKVELDLDDAPFLEEEEEDEEEEPEEIAEEAPAEPEAKRRLAVPLWLKSPKLLVMALAGLLLLAGLFFGLRWILSSMQDRELEDMAAQEEEVMPQAEPEPAAPEVKPATVALDPFWVEMDAPDATVHFLHVRFTLETTTEVEAEIQQKRLILRDAVYYYLRNKDFAFLSDTNNMEALKQDLLSVINKFLGTGMVSDLLVEQYLVQ